MTKTASELTANGKRKLIRERIKYRREIRRRRILRNGFWTIRALLTLPRLEAQRLYLSSLK